MLPSAALAAGLLALLSFAELSHAKTPPKNAVLLSKVQSLTLRDGKKTTARRVSAIPQVCNPRIPLFPSTTLFETAPLTTTTQLKCVGGSGCKHYTVDTLRCTNSGYGYTEDDVEWTCTASLPPEFKLGSTDVICEGYDSPNDPYILKGSCGVEYRLVLTDAGVEKYGSDSSWSQKIFGGGDQRKPASSAQGKVYGAKKEEGAGPFFWIIFWAVVIFFIWRVWPRGGPNRPANRRAGGGGWGGWGGGGGGGGGGGPFWPPNNDPPPPYDAQFPPKTSNTGGWQPGFWSGLLGGAAAGYATGRGSRGYRDRPADRSWYDTNHRGEGSWRSFGGGGGGGAGPSSSSTPSSSRYESTGFGSTSRR